MSERSVRKQTLRRRRVFVERSAEREGSARVPLKCPGCGWRLIFAFVWCDRSSCGRDGIATHCRADRAPLVEHRRRRRRCELARGPVRAGRIGPCTAARQSRARGPSVHSATRRAPPPPVPPRTAIPPRATLRSGQLPGGSELYRPAATDRCPAGQSSCP